MPHALNPKLYTLNPKPYALNPKPYNPKPLTCLGLVHIMPKDTVYKTQFKIFLYGLGRWIESLFQLAGGNHSQTQAQFTRPNLKYFYTVLGAELNPFFSWRAVTIPKHKRKLQKIDKWHLMS